METSKKLEELSKYVEHGEKARSDCEGCEHGRLLEALDTFLEEAQYYYSTPRLVALFEARRELDERWSPDGGDFGRGTA